MNKRLFCIILIAVGIGVFIRAYLLEGIYIASASMEPTLPLNTHLFVNKAIYRFKKPAKGEIVCFKSPVDSKKLVKRIIAVEGDTIRIKNKIVYLNSSQFYEPYAYYKKPDEILIGDNLGTLTVPSNYLFVMGDNRDQSCDSRDWKDPKTGQKIIFIQGKMVIGRIFGIY